MAIGQMKRGFLPRRLIQENVGAFITGRGKVGEFIDVTGLSNETAGLIFPSLFNMQETIDVIGVILDDVEFIFPLLFGTEETIDVSGVTEAAILIK